jgi:hypothetical protein
MGILSSIPVSVWIIAIVVLFVFILGRPKRIIDHQAKNAEALETLNQLDQWSKQIPNLDSGARAVLTSYLVELRTMFAAASSSYPTHKLTEHLRWIINENMVVLFPHLGNLSQDVMRESLRDFFEQLDEVRGHLAQNQLDEAARAAHKKFNWEMRDYYTL